MTRAVETILVIDTSAAKIRLAFGGGVLERESARQAADLPPLVAEILGGAAPDAIGVVAGPGSFTGIRLGISFAKGLAFGFGIPLVGMSAFDFFDDLLLALDSGRGDYFVSENGAHRIEKEPPAGARVITDYDIADGIGIVSEKLRAGAPEPVIPLYIRPSYAG
ncbi:MAG: tRNA (adenosine(37)-N6)-threonylcarbamoyltransferase complex dimerization subunit type 1 TsaB [Rickettsiales bacterium]|jgi:tRNA threonylcarbamoyl adenosine modification protein YeaZ|nr:tRNA (adenosine(37)-N6)-threonylcarbamoyltransferase complex dimerization subunit type 1 TsaB [Rickettsiales bacterium]